MKKYCNPFFEKKKENIKLLFGIIKNNSSIEYTNLIATYQYNTGVSQKTAKEHLKVLADMGSIVIEHGIVKNKGWNI